MMVDWISSKMKLPNINGIRIDCISEEDEKIVNFLNICTPSRLRLLAINCLTSNSIGIKSKFYIDAFSEVAARTSKQVYFTWITFNNKELQAIVRAARNTEDIVFNCCCIYCSSDLDFGANLSYKTKSLSFQLWGDARYEKRKTIWMKDPPSFSNIVNAISDSGLGTSLQKLSIADNPTLSVSEVQAELDSKGMSHISVVNQYDIPFES